VTLFVHLKSIVGRPRSSEPLTKGVHAAMSTVAH